MSNTATGYSEHEAVVDYYRAIGATLLGHLVGRQVRGRGGGPVASDGDGVLLDIADAADLDEAVRSGVVGFWLPDSTGPGRLALRMGAGEDTGIDTVATTALALMELMQASGIRVTALLDGGGGLYLAGAGDAGRFLAGAEADHSPAAGFARELADRSPEIATTSRADSAGRAWIEPLPAGCGGMPAPYSLVGGRHGLAVVAPLAPDEVAAATAGMPLEIPVAAMAERIRTRGDLAVELIGRAEPDA